MARAELSPQQLQEIREFAAEWGKIVSRRTFGEAGPGLDLDLRSMEALAREAAAGVLEGTLSTLLEQQAQKLGAEHPCPTCQKPCPVNHADRPLIAQGGQVTYHEPICSCPDCRRDFFPPTAHSGPG